LGAVEKLICWENLEIARYSLKKSTGEIVIKNLRPDQEKDKSHFVDEVRAFNEKL
jgi:peptide chain release factor subunit 1